MWFFSAGDIKGAFAPSSSMAGQKYHVFDPWDPCASDTRTEVDGLLPTIVTFLTSFVLRDAKINIIKIELGGT